MNFLRYDVKSNDDINFEKTNLSLIIFPIFAARHLKGGIQVELNFILNRDCSDYSFQFQSYVRLLEWKVCFCHTMWNWWWYHVKPIYVTETRRHIKFKSRSSGYWRLISVFLPRNVNFFDHIPQCLIWHLKLHHNLLFICFTFSGV